MEDNYDLVVLKYTDSDDGKSELVGKVDNYLEEMNQLLENNIRGDEDIFVQDAIMTDNGEFIRIAARINQGVQNVTIQQFEKEITENLTLRLILFNCGDE